VERIGADAMLGRAVGIRYAGQAVASEAATLPRIDGMSPRWRNG
jgi:hypothetical protein